MGELRLKAIGKTFPGGVRALDDLSLTIRQGELMVLLGPSGCGKSTLLRIIAGLEKPSNGEVLLDGRSVAELPPPRRPFALVFQNYALYPHLSAEENLTYPLRARKVAGSEIRRRLAEAAELLRLDRAELKRKPGELSGGQRQRVALGKAIMRKPAVFLLDEPLSNLDQRLRLHLRAELRRVQRALAATMLLVTHDQGEAAALGDRVALLKKGRLAQAGSPRELYLAPKNLFVAEFMSNPGLGLIRGKLAARDGRLHFREAEGGSLNLALSTPQSQALWPRAGQGVILGARPEAVAVDPVAQAPAGRARLLEVEFAGANAHLRLDSGAHLLGCLAPSSPAWRVGQELPLWLDPEKLFFFDPENGANLFMEQDPGRAQPPLESARKNPL